MFLAIGSIGFILLCVVVSILFIMSLEVERIGWAALALIGGFVAMAYWGDFNIIHFATENPLLLATLVGGYFVAGTAWAMAKWWFYVRDCRNRYDERKKDFLNQHGAGGKHIPNNLLEEWRSVTARVSDCAYGNPLPLNAAPQVRSNKARIMHWMMFWPWSFAWTIVNDPIKKLFKRIYRSIQGTLQKISDRAYRGVEDDFREAPQSPDSEQGPGPAPFEDENASSYTSSHNR